MSTVLAAPAAARPAWRSSLEVPWILALVASAPSLAGVWLGYGTDIDIPNVLRAGQSALDGDYAYSRPPGALPHELGTRLLDLAGGSVAVALASVFFGFVTLWCVGWLVKAEHRSPVPTVAVIAANPWWWVATTSLGDFVWALAAVTGGAVLARQDRRFLAGIAFGLAIGVRASSVVLVLAWAVAERSAGPARARWRPTLETVGVAALVSVALFVPSWLTADRTAAFLSNEFEVSGPAVLVGRWAVKNLAFFGLAATVVLVASAGVLVRCLRQWTSSWAVRFGALAVLATELLFLRFPWKPIHLLPALVGLALLVSVKSGWRWHAVFVAAGLLHAVVAVTVAEPDVPHRATGGTVAVSIVPGVIVNEIDCRLDDRRQGPWPDPDTQVARDRALALFDCQASVWRTEPDGGSAPVEVPTGSPAGESSGSSATAGSPASPSP